MHTYLQRIQIITETHSRHSRKHLIHEILVPRHHKPIQRISHQPKDASRPTPPPARGVANNAALDRPYRSEHHTHIVLPSLLIVRRGIGVRARRRWRGGEHPRAPRETDDELERSIAVRYDLRLFVPVEAEREFYDRLHYDYYAPVVVFWVGV